MVWKNGLMCAPLACEVEVPEAKQYDLFAPQTDIFVSLSAWYFFSLNYIWITFLFVFMYRNKLSKGLIIWSGLARLTELVSLVLCPSREKKTKEIIPVNRTSLPHVIIPKERNEKAFEWLLTDSLLSDIAWWEFAGRQTLKNAQRSLNSAIYWMFCKLKKRYRWLWNSWGSFGIG